MKHKVGWTVVWTFAFSALGMLALPVAARDPGPTQPTSVKRSATSKPAKASSGTTADRQALAREQEAMALFAAQALSEQQLALADKVHLGGVACEGASQVVVRAMEPPGKFVLELGKRSFWMVPVATDSGALRLEDGARGVVWLQLANKSMLLDQRQGRRLADGCMNEAQQRVAREMERNPASHLLSAPQQPAPVRVAAQSPEQ